MSFEVITPGALTLLTDKGRFGQHKIGLTSGGPMDVNAFYWANKILGNQENSTTLEVAMGGLTLKSNVQTQICVTGANMPVSLNGQIQPDWQSINVNKGDTIELGYCNEGLRSYLAVSGGFEISPEFGSTATVVREGIGGIDGGVIKKGNNLPCQPSTTTRRFMLSTFHRPKIQQEITLRVVLGYQYQAFSRLDQRRFFSGTYVVSNQCDRMGYRLEGPAIKANNEQMLSEGICLGAIQVPANGQPIILMNDRQTIGGYPKIGSVFSLDLDLLAQASPGTKIRFEAITAHCAHNQLELNKVKLSTTSLEEVI